MVWLPKRGAEVTWKPDVKVWKEILALPKQFVAAYLHLKRSYSSFEVSDWAAMKAALPRKSDENDYRTRLLVLKVKMIEPEN